jgi:hypothetical protein
VQNPFQLTAGWVDSSIHDFLLEIDEPSAAMAYALITCLDSSFDVGSIVSKSPQMSVLKAQGKVVGKGLLLTTRRLVALERKQRMFFGFDEIWFFHDAQVAPKPKKVVISGPNRISSKTIEQAAEWLQSNNGSLGLGDGTGMNFCARLRGVAKHLVEILSDAEASRFAENKATAS